MNCILLFHVLIRYYFESPILVLKLEEGQLISVKNVSLSKATFVKFRAQSVDFLDITNHRAVLEFTLRKFTCLTEGDQICISHSGKLYYLDIREVKPNGAASIIETDCDVDFEEPVGYKDSEYAKYERHGSDASNDTRSTVSGVVSTVVRELQKGRVVTAEEQAAVDAAFKPFTGNAKRIDGRPIAEMKGDLSNSSHSASATASATSDSKSDTQNNITKPPLGAAVAAATVTLPTGPVYQSRIGDKYSKKKSVISSIADPSQKFAGPANTLRK